MANTDKPFTAKETALAEPFLKALTQAKAINGGWSQEVTRAMGDIFVLHSSMIYGDHATLCLLEEMKVEILHRNIRTGKIKEGLTGGPLEDDDPLEEVGINRPE